ncbi:hypothetical protein CSE16_17305 [Solibacillus sp. R5-41]|nr:DUF418 domain-containing protein [Solibacillus sp. R5-41]ATP42488.1 hypothetical protein CSE16_17305 [Solibacillus sp. R5-41]
MNNTQRLPLIDILRGFAVLGTLGTNIWIFAYFGDLSYITTSAYAGWWSLNDFIRMLVLFFVNGKLLGLLTIMFGVGLELKYQQSVRKGNAWPGVYIWTVLFLFVEGFIHFTFVMEYDILMSYAVTAMIVAFILKAGDKAINRTLYLVGGFHAFIILLVLITTLLGANVTLPSNDAIVSIYQNGTWFEQIDNRLTNFWFFRTEAIFIIPMNIFLFLIGVKLMRNGVFSQDENGRQARNKLFSIGLYIGVPLNFLIFIPGGAFDLPVRYLFAPVMALGYIGVFGKMIEYKKGDWLWKRFGQVGKMSLSIYVLQNIMASFIFYGWGLGLGGKLNSLEVIAIWITLSLLQLFIAQHWIKYFHVGPMEWIRKFAVQAISNK